MRAIYRNILFSSFAVALLASCGSGGDGLTSDGKMEHTAQINSVEVMELKRTDFPRQLVANGKLSVSSRRCLNFGVSGSISEVYVRNGMSVRRGDVIAELERPDLKLALEAARISLEKAEIDLYDVLIGLGYSSGDTLNVPGKVLEMAKIRSGYSAALNSLARARYECDAAVLKAPVSGRVASLKSDGTSSGASSEPFCVILDDSSMRVSFSVMESDFDFLEEGLPVKLSPFADPSKTFAGKITDINPQVDKYGQIVVGAALPADKSLVDGMNVRVTVEKSMKNRLVVPRSAVVIRDNMDVLFTFGADGKAHWVYVNVLDANRDSFAVEANAERGASLSEGEKVIVSSNLNLADGSEVRLKTVGKAAADGAGNVSRN